MIAVSPMVGPLLNSYQDKQHSFCEVTALPFANTEKALQDSSVF